MAICVFLDTGVRILGEPIKAMGTAFEGVDQDASLFPTGQELTPLFLEIMGRVRPVSQYLFPPVLAYDTVGESDVPLAVGLFVEAEILGREVRDVVVLPRSALRDGDQVFVVDAEGRLRFRDVAVRRRYGSDVVIGQGLASGERVCISSVAAPVDGMRVRVAGVPGEDGA